MNFFLQVFFHTFTLQVVLHEELGSSRFLLGPNIPESAQVDVESVVSRNSQFRV